MSTVKQKVREIADSLPEDATWERVRYEIYVRQQIEKGEADIAAGRLIPHDEVKRRFPTA